MLQGVAYLAEFITLRSQCACFSVIKGIISNYVGYDNYIWIWSHPGVLQFVYTARLLRQLHRLTQFCMVGF